MAVELNDLVKWLWVAPVSALWGSFEKRLGNKVSKRECAALHGGLQTEIKNLRKHVDDKFDDWKEFQNQKTNLIISEIKKVNGSQ